MLQLSQLKVLVTAVTEGKRDTIYRVILEATAGLHGRRGENAVSDLLARSRESLKEQASTAARNELFGRGLTDHRRDALYANRELSADAHALWGALKTLKARASEANTIRRAAEDDDEVRQAILEYLARGPNALGASSLLTLARTPRAGGSGVAATSHGNGDASKSGVQDWLGVAIATCGRASSAYELGIASGLLLSLPIAGRCTLKEAEALVERALSEAPPALRSAIPQADELRAVLVTAVATLSGTPS